MTQLQKIVSKAKSLKKSYPNTKWTDLIKKASKLVTPAKKSVSGIKRTIVKKTAPAIPLIKKRIVSKSDFAMAGIKKKKATKKAHSKTKIGYKSDRIDQLKKTTPYIRKYKKEGFSRKDAIKNAMLDAGYMSGTKTHKDTKSHNVNIRVVSGINKDNLNQLNHYVTKLTDLKEILIVLQNDLKQAKRNKDLMYVKKVLDAIKHTKLAIEYTKNHITIIKKTIK
jgi:hypothetical protein